MSDQRKDDLYDDELDQNTSKTELANKIAERSNRVAHTYQHIEDAVIRAIRWFSSLLNKILFSKKYAKITALVMAILLYFYVNYNSLSSVYTSPLKSTRRLDDVTVTAKYNSDTFELSGLVKTVDISIVGDANNVTNAITGGGVIVADLEGMTEGTHEVRLTSEGFGNNVDVICDPSTVIITLKKKTTQQFDLSYDFINLNQMESIYAVGEPTFEYSKVNVRASKDTLDSIAFVKALIDVSNQASEFEQEARLIAYNASGEPVSADIIPSTVHVTVPVTSPSKTVPIEIQVIGEVATEGMAIESIDCDQMTVTIYGPNNVLASVEKVYVQLNADNVTKDSTVLRPIQLPSGVNSSSINQITMTITLGPSETRTINNVPISYKNNLNNYKVSQPDNKSTTSIRVIGTAGNIESVTANDIKVYVDMTEAKPGLMEFALSVDQPSSGYIKYQLTETTLELNVLGETNDVNDEGGKSDNNG